MMKKANKKLVVVIVLFFILVCILGGGFLCAYLMAIHNSAYNETCAQIGSLVWQIVDESYDNYGNIEFSEYKDVVSSDIYDKMYYMEYFRDENGEYPDRSEYKDIRLSYHSYVDVTLNSSTEATATYEVAYDYVPAEAEASYRGEHPYYSLHTGEMRTCMVTLELQDDGKWHIVDFSRLQSC